MKNLYRISDEVYEDLYNFLYEEKEKILRPFLDKEKILAIDSIRSPNDKEKREEAIIASQKREVVETSLGQIVSKFNDWCQKEVEGT